MVDFKKGAPVFYQSNILTSDEEFANFCIIYSGEVALLYQKDRNRK
jgi:hypothetical protein